MQHINAIQKITNKKKDILSSAGKMNMLSLHKATYLRPI